MRATRCCSGSPGRKSLLLDFPLLLTLCGFPAAQPTIFSSAPVFITDSEGLHTLLAFGITNQNASGGQGCGRQLCGFSERIGPCYFSAAGEGLALAFAAGLAATLAGVCNDARSSRSLPAWRHGIGYACFCGHWFLAWNRAPLSLQNRNNLLVSVYILTEKAERTRGKPEKLKRDNKRRHGGTATGDVHSASCICTGLEIG